MNGSQPSGFTEGVQTAEPWGAAKPHLKDIMSRSQQLYETGGPKMYEGPLVAPTSPETLQAQAMRADRARMGDPLTQGAKGYTSSVLSGDMLPGRNARPAYDIGGRAPAAFQRETNPAPLDALRQRTGMNFGAGVDPATYAHVAGGGAGFSSPPMQPQGQYGGSAFPKPAGAPATPTFGGTSLGRAATNYATGTASGGWLGRNPYLDSMVDRASQGVVRNYQRAVDPGLRSNAILSGRTGANNANATARRQSQEVLGETLGNIATDTYGRDYQNERGMQQQAAFAAPGLAAPDLGLYESERGRMEAAANRAPGLGAMDYADIDALSQVGAEREGQAERQIGEAVQKHTYLQEQPYQALQRYMDVVRGAPGGTTTTQEPIYRNKAAGALGGGLAGAQIGSIMDFSNPWLAALSAGGAYLGSR